MTGRLSAARLARWIRSACHCLSTGASSRWISRMRSSAFSSEVWPASIAGRSRPLCHRADPTRDKSGWPWRNGPLKLRRPSRCQTSAGRLRDHQKVRCHPIAKTPLAPGQWRNVRLQVPVPAGALGKVPGVVQSVRRKVREDVDIAIEPHLAACCGTEQQEPPAMLACIRRQYRAHRVDRTLTALGLGRLTLRIRRTARAAGFLVPGARVDPAPPKA